jgi:hypothetical protein
MANTLLELTRALAPDPHRRAAATSQFSLRLVAEYGKSDNVRPIRDTVESLGGGNHRQGEARLLQQLRERYEGVWSYLEAEAGLMFPEGDPFVDPSTADVRDPFEEPERRPHQDMYWDKGTFLGWDHFSHLPELMRPVRAAGLNCNSLDGLCTEQFQHHWRNQKVVPMGESARNWVDTTRSLAIPKEQRELARAEDASLSISLLSPGQSDARISLPIVYYDARTATRRGVWRRSSSTVVAQSVSLAPNVRVVLPVVIGYVCEMNGDTCTDLLARVNPIMSNMWRLALVQTRHLVPGGATLTTTRWFGTYPCGGGEIADAERNALAYNGIGLGLPDLHADRKKALMSGRVFTEMMALMTREARPRPLLHDLFSLDGVFGTDRRNIYDPLFS